MKPLIACILFLTFSVVKAQYYVVSPIEPSMDPSYIVSPPVANQDFSLWSPHTGCFNKYTVEPEILVDVVGSEVRVFFHAGLIDSITCVSPTPPIYVQRAEINGLNAGTYTLSTYNVPYEDTFPPAIVDYPAYFVESFEFQVFGQPPAVSVNTTTNLGLVLLGLCVLLAGTLFHKRRFFN